MLKLFHTPNSTPQYTVIIFLNLLNALHIINYAYEDVIQFTLLLCMIVLPNVQ